MQGNLFARYEDSARKKYQSWCWLPEHVTWCCQEATQPAAGGDDQHGHAEVVIEDEGANRYGTAQPVRTLTPRARYDKV